MERKNFIRAILCASVMFGLVHLSNAALPGVTFQGISAAAVGMVISAAIFILWFLFLMRNHGVEV